MMNCTHLSISTDNSYENIVNKHLQDSTIYITPTYTTQTWHKCTHIHTTDETHKYTHTCMYARTYRSLIHNSDLHNTEITFVYTLSHNTHMYTPSHTSEPRKTVYSHMHTYNLFTYTHNADLPHMQPRANGLHRRTICYESWCPNTAPNLNRGKSFPSNSKHELSDSVANVGINIYILISR